MSSFDDSQKSAEQITEADEDCSTRSRLLWIRDVKAEIKCLLEDRRALGGVQIGDERT